MRKLVAVLSLVALSGCASVKLDGIIDVDVCNAPGQAAASRASASSRQGDLSKLSDALMPSPGIVSGLELSNPQTTDADVISGEDIALGQRRLPDKQNAAPSGMALVPWLSGTDSMYLQSRSKEANDARGQLNALWGKSPGLSFRLRSVSVASGVQVINQNLGEFSREDAEMMRKIGQTLVAGGYDALLLGTAGKLFALTDPQSQPVRVQELLQQFNTARFISVYVRAYFRGGHLFQASLDVDGLVKKFGDKIKNSVKPDQLENVDKLLKELFENGCQPGSKEECLLTPALGTQSFVTRAGQSVQFAGVTVTFGEKGTLSPTLQYPKSDELAPQLVRVVFEAIYDSHGIVVPAVSSATVCTEKLRVGDEACLPESKSPGSKSGGTPPTMAQRVAWVDQYANQVETVVTEGASELIRGAGWVALNNEAVARAVETTAGVNGRKIAEKALWNLQSQCENRGKDELPGVLRVNVR